MNLPYLGDRPRCATPKHAIPMRLDEHEDARKRDAQRAKAFRDRVWKDADSKCVVCGRRCRRTLELAVDAGHVDHRLGRNVAPQDRYNPKKARLLCGRCHLKKHGQRI